MCFHINKRLKHNRIEQSLKFVEGFVELDNCPLPTFLFGPPLYGISSSGSPCGSVSEAFCFNIPDFGGSGK